MIDVLHTLFLTILVWRTFNVKNYYQNFLFHKIHKNQSLICYFINLFKIIEKMSKSSFDFYEICEIKNFNFFNVLESN